MPEALFNAKQYSDLAKAQVGKKYILGEPNPYNKVDPQALDCSGLVIYLNNTSGAFRMTDDTAAGLYNRSKAVSGSPAVGDLVFLRNNPARSNGIGHMAVITGKLSNGDWRIIEARGRASGVVSTTLSYWKTRRYYTGVRRLPGFKLAADSEVTPPVTPPTPKPTKTVFNVSTYNCVDLRFGGKANDDAKIISALGSSVNLLTEAPETIRNNLRVARGGKSKWLVWTRDDSKSQTIMFEKKKFAYTDKDSVTFGPTSYHGAVIAVLKRRETGKKVQFAALHMPPTKLYKNFDEAEDARRKFFKKLTDKLDPNMPTVIGGDFNSEGVEEWPELNGFVAAPTGATTDSGSRLDYLLVRSGTWKDTKVINSGTASDHNGIRSTVTIANSTT